MTLYKTYFKNNIYFTFTLFYNTFILKKNKQTKQIIPRKKNIVVSEQ